MDKCKEALLQFLGTDYDEDDIEVKDYDSAYGVDGCYDFATPEGTFTVVPDDKVAEVKKREIESLVDDMGIETFSKDYQQEVIENFMTFPDGESWMREDYESYLEEIENEGSSWFEDRLQEELFEMKFDIHSSEMDAYKEYREAREDEERADEADELYQPEYAEYDKFLESYEAEKEHLKEEFVQSRIDDYDSPIDYIIQNFGKEELKRLYEEGHLEFDIDALAEDVARQDGYGSLSAWDGNDNEEYVDGKTFHIFKQDEEVFEKEPKRKTKSDVERD